MKRGGSGLSLVVVANKPQGITSHDVVNRCRRIFQERRVGHTGTLDPLATGVLPICIGPATRLDKYMTSHDKSYRVTLGFGYETTTDDIEGELTFRAKVSRDLEDGAFAEAYVAGLKGEHKQIPPAYSAIKVNGKKAYELAREGRDVDLAPRRIEVYDSKLVDRKFDATGKLTWIVDLSVSKGTYIRALVRDMGRELGSLAHVVALERRRAGSLSIDDCMSLDTIELLKEQAAADPVKLLGYRFAYADGFEKLVSNGSKIDADALTLMRLGSDGEQIHCRCFGSDARESAESPEDGEIVSLIVANKLKALYKFDSKACVFRSSCVFATAVNRG